MTMPFHPLADLFPLMKGNEFDELVYSIKQHGLREPITLYEGTILDGRNRYRACEVAGVEPRFVQFTGNDFHEFVTDKNLHRRHLNPSQLGLIGAKMATLKIGNPNMKKSSPITDKSAIAPSAGEVAKILGISSDTIVNAKRVLLDGTTEEIAAVERGEASVTTIADAIRKRNPYDPRKGRPVVTTSGNQNRIQAQRMKGKMWADLRDALLALTNLPKPSDLVPVARAHDKTGLVDARLFKSLQWLKDFSHEWSKRNKTAGQEGPVSDDHADTGIGG